MARNRPVESSSISSIGSGRSSSSSSLSRSTIPVSVSRTQENSLTWSSNAQRRSSRSTCTFFGIMVDNRVGLGLFIRNCSGDGIHRNRRCEQHRAFTRSLTSGACYLPAPTMDGRFILVEGARQNNLKNVGVRVPVGAVTAVTGVAGAGKSSLAFDVLHAEGYRRYVETFSPYARQFLERLDRPAADRIEGVLPSLAIDRTAPVRTSRSTVGTMTSIADYLRALWARAAVLHCMSCGQAVVRDSPSSIFEALISAAGGKQVLLCFPCLVGRVSAKALRETLQEAGFRRVLEGGRPIALEDAELRAHDGVVTVVLDRILAERYRRQRIIDSLESALRYGKGRVETHIDGHEEPLRFSEALHRAR